MSKIKTNKLENLAGTKQFTVDEVRVMLDEVASGNVGIGVGQTWQDCLNVDVDGQGKRVFGTNYFNHTDKPIQVSAYGYGGTGNALAMEIKVDNVQVGNEHKFALSGVEHTVNLSGIIVPSGSKYQFNSGATITRWAELRETP